MAYTKTNWTARQGTSLNRFLKTEETENSVVLTNEPTQITEPGTPFSTENMNHIEDGIEDAHEAIAAEEQERQAADEGLQDSIGALDARLQQNIQAETQERQTADAALQDSIDGTDENLKTLENHFHSWIGRGGYLAAHDFGTSAPSQQDLTAQALSQITSADDPLQVWNGTKIENLYDGHLWALTNTQDTDPPVFEWSDQGPARISPFAQGSGGYIVGADPNTDGGGYIEAMEGGKAKVIGWDQIIAASAFLAAHPVGSIYMSADPVNPGILHGGTWEAWGQGRVPVGVDPGDADFNEAEKTGGEKTHQLTVEELAVHSHIYTSTGFNYYVPNGNYYGMLGQVGGSSTGNTGNNVPHNNLQPYVTCYMWKRTA